jgi:thiamine biosynthesis lipoprotein
LRVDLGGIAKGYAVDRAVLTLRDAGMEQIIVNAGGDLRVAGPERCSVDVRHPQSPSLSGCGLELQTASLATSAAYFSRSMHQGREVSALVNPVSGAAYVGSRSVSIVAADCMTADALTKIVLFGSLQRAQEALSRFAAQAYVLGPDLPVAA